MTMLWRRLVVAICACLAVSACQGQLVELPEWVVSVPDGTPVHEYAELPGAGSRETAVELVPELVLGEGRNEPSYLFSQASGFDVASDGRIFVADRESDHVRVFGPTGDHLRTFGQRGQGPGDFLFSDSGYVILEIVGDRMLVFDGGNRRFSIWSTDGVHLRDGRPYTGRQRLNGFRALNKTTLVGRLQTTLARREWYGRWRRYQIALLDTEGAPFQTLAEREAPPSILGTESLEATVSVIRPRYEFVIDPARSTVYVASQQPYQVFAFGPEGKMRWALRSVYDPLPYPEEEKEKQLDRLRSQGVTAEVDDFDWPEALPAVFGLAVDGHGHLYVFHWGYPVVRREYEVDVYGVDGQRLFGGRVQAPSMPWITARDDSVYDWHRLEDGNETVVRYRIVEPF